MAATVKELSELKAKRDRLSKLVRTIHSYQHYYEQYRLRETGFQN